MASDDKNLLAQMILNGLYRCQMVVALVHIGEIL